MEKFFDFNKKLVTANMTVTAARVDDSLFELLAELENNYQWLLNTATPGDIFISGSETSLRQRIADVADLRARAFETVRRFDDAIAEFDRAAGLYEQIDDLMQAQRSRDKANQLRFSTTGDFDAELERLRVSLENAKPRTLNHVQVLIALGELHSSANDDFQAIHFLHEAERELRDLGGYPSAGELRSALSDTVTGIKKGEQVEGASPIETAMLRRALTQRLLLAIGNAYRTTDPTRAAEYEERLRKLDDDGVSNMRELLGQFVDAGLDVGKFLQSVPTKR